MADWYRSTNYQVGLTADTLVSLRDMDIPIPDQVVFHPAARHYQRADYTRVSDGFPFVEWIWDILSIDRLMTLLEFLEDAEYNDVYVRTDVRDGTQIVSEAFQTYTAVMLKPILSGQEGVHVARSPRALQTVKIVFRKLEAV